MQLTRLLRPIALVAVVGALLLPGAAPALAADPVTDAFVFTGAEQSWVVPAGVTSIHAVVVGARGGGVGPGSMGGLGHRAEADVTVTPGQTIYVEVGGPGAASDLTTGGAGGFNGGADGGDGGALGNGGGGGGGGGTDLRTVSRTSPGTVGSRLIVAGGGGGDGAGANGGAGGDAGTAGGNSIGGGAIGGAPGFDGEGTSGCGGCGGNPGGEDGVMGLGGRGGNDPTAGNGDSGAGGGGGGGGYQGGGGGGGGPGSSAGGGGGSSLADGWNYTNPNVAVDTIGTSSASITYVPGGGGGPGGESGSGTVDAAITMADSTLCLELSTSTIDFGMGQFGQVGVVGAPDVSVTNCGETSATLLGRGTNATGTGASWALSDNAATCADTLGTDAFHMSLREGVEGSTAAWRLGTTNKELLELPAGFDAPFRPAIDTACPGSSGAGQRMSMQIIFVATEATP